MQSQAPKSKPADTQGVPYPGNDANETADDVRLFLVAIKGPDTGRWIELSELPLTGGRDPDRDIVFTDTDVSRLHVLIGLLDGSVVVEDLGSTNGTFVDGQRVRNRAPLPVGSSLRVGNNTFRCERCTRRDMARAVNEQRDLQRAYNYVLSLLPPAVTDGPLRADWIFKPSARLGGDSFGYGPLDSRTFAIYLLDVSGHGVGAAMHSVSVLNVLRQRALAHTDYADPVQVLTSLNAMFPMERHDDQYFTIWYGVYDTMDRRLTFASAGHHPGYLVTPDRATALPLRTPGPIAGVKADARFTAAETRVPAGSTLYLFSDGVFEIPTPERQWRLEDFRELLLQPVDDDTSECRRLYEAVKAASREGSLDDDFSLLAVTFT